MRAAALPHAGVLVNQRAILAEATNTSHVIALPDAPAVGSMQVCIFRQIRVPGDLTSAPSGFTLASGAMIQNGAGAFSMGLWYRVTQAGDTGSLTFTGTSALASAALYEIVGLTGAAPDYQAHDAGGSNVTTCPTGTIASTSARGFAIAAIGINGNGGTFGNAWINSFRRSYAASAVTHRLAVATRHEVPAGTALSSEETWTTARRGLGLVACFPQAA